MRTISRPGCLRRDLWAADMGKQTCGLVFWTDLRYNKKQPMEILEEERTTMVQETKRFLSYICPHCMQSVIVERDLFSLAAARPASSAPAASRSWGWNFSPAG